MAETGWKAKIRTFFKSKAFVYRAWERVEKHIWGSSFRFALDTSTLLFFLQTHTPSEPEMLLKGKQEKDQICTVASFWVYFIKGDLDLAIL